MLVSGLALVIASFANATSPAQLRKGGIFRVGTTGASVQVDPQLTYITTAWWLEYATAAKLYNYPDRRGRAGASSFPRSRRGSLSRTAAQTYTFFIRKGFRFSDGEPVTARSFKCAINRVANNDLDSPGAEFIIKIRTELAGTNIVGAQGRPRRPRERRQRCPRQGKPADHPPDPARRRVPVARSRCRSSRRPRRSCRSTARSCTSAT